MSPSHPTPIPPARDVLEWSAVAQGAGHVEDLLEARPMPDALCVGLWIATEYAGLTVRELADVTGKSKSAIAGAIVNVRERRTVDPAFKRATNRLEDRFADAFPAGEDEEPELDPGELELLNQQALERLNRLYPPRT